MSAKQEESILQWASHLLQEQVSSLKAIQDVKFVKNLLWRIDDEYFREWEEGAGQESYSQVLERVGKYFKEEIGTDIAQHLQSLNVYRNVREVWQLLLGVAIKGNNRNNNITLIFELDHSMQAELVKIVTDIIDRFGQNTAVIDADNEQEEEQPQDRQMAVELAQENQFLREEYQRLEGELAKELQEKAAALIQRKQLERSLEIMRLEKSAFLEVLANANRIYSRIFEDGDSSILETQSNLSQLAQDIVQFIRHQRKSIESAQEANALLEEEVQELRDTVRRCAEQNQHYLLRMSDLTIYQREIQALRTEISEKFDENIALLEQVSNLEDDKARLLMTIQSKKYGESFPHQKDHNDQPNLEGERQPQTQEQRQQQQRLQRKATLQNQQMRDNVNGSGLQDSGVRYSEVGSEDAKGQRMEDELREPQLRNKLQREVTFLKKTISSLTKQIDVLKKTNEAMQRSAKTFMEGNQQVINKWQHDYQTLLAQIQALSSLNQNLTNQNTQSNQQNQQLAIKLKSIQQDKVKQHHNDSIDSGSNSQISSEENIIITVSPPNSNPQIPPPQQEKDKMNKVALWDQIVKKLQEIVRDGKTKELAYEKTIQSLRNQNYKLIDLLRTKPRGGDEHEETAQIAVAPQEPLPAASPLEDSFFSKLQRVQSEELRDSHFHPVRPPRLSYVQIQEGEQLEESAVSRLKKSHYNVNSKIVNDFAERKQGSFVSNQEYYYALNQKLNASIKEGLDGISRTATREPSGELQKRLEDELSRIGQQYQRLNANYQAVFAKLNIYTQSLREKESVTIGYQEVLQEISKAEAEVTAAHQAEIVSLRLRNEALMKHLTRCALEKEELLGVVGKLEASVGAARKQERSQQQAALREMELVVKEASNRYNACLSDPLTFLESCLEVSKEEGQLQKFYRLYIQQKQRTKQLNEELELLSSVLLEYRNMILA